MASNSFAAAAAAAAATVATTVAAIAVCCDVGSLARILTSTIAVVITAKSFVPPLPPGEVQSPESACS